MRRTRSGSGWSTWRGGVAGLVVAVMAAAGAVAVPMASQAGATASGVTCVGTGFPTTTDATLGQGQGLCNGTFAVVMQPDGNLVEYKAGSAIWSTQTSNATATAQFSGGDLRVVNSAGGTLWQSAHTGPTTFDGKPQVDSLVLLSSGNLQITDQDDTVIWQTGTLADAVVAQLTAGQSLASSSGDYRLTMQGDGNLVLYFNPGGGDAVVWSTATQGNAGAHASLQLDGNLVVYSSAGTALWSAGSSAPNPTLAVQDDGNVVVYGTNTAGQYAAWATNTVGDRGPSLGDAQTLQPGQFLESASGQYKLVMSQGGLLALVTTGPYVCPMWTAPAIVGGSDGYETPLQPGSYLEPSTTGDLDLFAPGTTNSLWRADQTSTWTGGGNGTGVSLTLGTDGNLVLYSSDGEARWTSGTNDLRGSVLCTGATLQTGQYLVPWYTAGGSPSDQPFTALTPPRTANSHFVMQSTCNLVFYTGGHAAWSSQTDEGVASNGEGVGDLFGSLYYGCYATMQATGNLVIYAPSWPGGARALWQSGTTQSNPLPFQLGAIGPYVTVPVENTAKTYIWAPFVVTAHGTTLGDPSPPSKSKVLQILSDVLNAVTLVLTFVGGPLGAVFDSIGNALTGASLAAGAAGVALSGTGTKNDAVAAQATTTAGPAVCGTGQPSSGSHLPTGLLTSGQCLIAPNHQSELIMQSDGNLVLYNDSGQALWSTDTAGNPGAFLRVQANGYMAVISADNQTQLFYATGSQETPNPNLVLEDSGNLVLYANGTGGGVPTAVWASNTGQVTVSTCTAGQSQMTSGTVQSGACLFSANGKYRLQMQVDGNVVLTYLPLDQPLWNSNTAGHPGAWLQLWPNGTLAVEASTGQQVWSTKNPAPSAVMALGNSGNLVLYGNNSLPDHPTVPYAAWQTGTTNLRGNTLPSGTILSPGQYLQSQTGTYKLSMGTTGLLELSYTTASQYFCPMWSRPLAEATLTRLEGAVSGFTGETYTPPLVTGSYVAMQSDGDLVLVRPGTKPPISISTTQGNPGAYLQLGGDGNLVVYSSAGSALWQAQSDLDRGTALCSGASLSNNQYLTSVGHPGKRTADYLVMHTTCNLVYYGEGGKEMWASNTYYGPGVSEIPASPLYGCYATMQTTGNLVIYAPHYPGGKPAVLWASNTDQGSAPPNLVKNLGPYTLAVEGGAGGDTGGDFDIVSDSAVNIYQVPTTNAAADAADGNAAFSAAQLLVGFLEFVLPLLL